MQGCRKLLLFLWEFGTEKAASPDQGFGVVFWRKLSVDKSPKPIAVLLPYASSKFGCCWTVLNPACQHGEELARTVSHLICFTTSWPPAKANLSQPSLLKRSRLLDSFHDIQLPGEPAGAATAGGGGGASLDLVHQPDHDLGQLELELERPVLGSLVPSGSGRPWLKTPVSSSRFFPLGLLLGAGGLSAQGSIRARRSVPWQPLADRRREAVQLERCCLLS